MNEIHYALAYPTLLLCVLLCGTLICDDHQFVGVSRYEEHPWVTWRWWFCCIVRVDWAWFSLWAFL